MLFFNSGGLSIYHTDITALTAIPEGSVDLVVTSPPYNVNKGYDLHDDDTSHEDYLVWSKQWLAKVFVLTKSGGRICINIPTSTFKLGKNKTDDGSLIPFSADIIKIAEKVGWKYRTTIIWNKVVTGTSAYAIGTMMEARSPAVAIGIFESIVVLFKDTWKRAAGESDISKEEYLSLCDGIWTFHGEHNKIHPAVFPVELPRRCIKMFSFIGDTILEPFLGTGTTLLAASWLKRKAIGTDISLKYCQFARRRLSMFTRAGRAQLLSQAGLGFTDRDGVSNLEMVEKMKAERRERMTQNRIKNIRSFL